MFGQNPILWKVKRYLREYYIIYIYQTLLYKAT